MRASELIQHLAKHIHENGNHEVILLVEGDSHDVVGCGPDVDPEYDTPLHCLLSVADVTDDQLRRK